MASSIRDMQTYIAPQHFYICLGY
jgi:hypothetical protein